MQRRCGGPGYSSPVDASRRGLQVTVGQQNKLLANSFETRINNLVTSSAPQIPAGLHYKVLGGHLHDLFPGTLFFEECSQWILLYLGH